MPPPVSREVREAAVAEYLDGAASMTVAAKHGVSATSVLTWVRADEGSVRSRRRRRPDDSSDKYVGGWEIRGGISYPLRPEPRGVLSVDTAKKWDNGTARTGALTPAGPNHHPLDTTERRG